MKIKSIKVMMAGLMIIAVMAFSVGLLAPISVSAAGELKDGATAAHNADTPTEIKVVIKNITNTALFIIGAISTLMLIYGGIRYTISGGDEKAITSAKNTILYAVIGIVVAVAAYAIVNFVITALT